ncbi:MAG TPA: RDD family protein [Chthonomonadaceae bacterium]|nr:RDD family protein [Chthonomonadaceae bacterium]
MSRTVTIVTPENIQVTYQVAGIASRFMATVVDLTLQFLLLLLVGVVMKLTIGRNAGIGMSVSSILTALGYIAVFLILFAYPIFFEMLWGGRTPGKRLFGLRVIRDGGYPINFIASAIRNILRFIDIGVVPMSGTALVLWGMPGLLSIFFSPRYKRIGDYAAGTLVIMEAGATPFGAKRRSVLLPSGVVAFFPLIKNLDRLTPDEYRILRRFTERRGELDLVVQAAIGERLARPLMQKLEIEAPIAYQVQYADLLEAIERRYAEERGVL